MGGAIVRHYCRLALKLLQLLCLGLHRRCCSPPLCGCLFGLPMALGWPPRLCRSSNGGNPRLPRLLISMSSRPGLRKGCSSLSIWCNALWVNSRHACYANLSRVPHVQRDIISLSSRQCHGRVIWLCKCRHLLRTGLLKCQTTMGRIIPVGNASATAPILAAAAPDPSLAAPGLLLRCSWFILMPT
jgi:hypothetical protein